jgi:hypothetical protein
MLLIECELSATMGHIGDINLMAFCSIGIKHLKALEGKVFEALQHRDGCGGWFWACQRPLQPASSGFGIAAVGDMGNSR